MLSFCKMGAGPEKCDPIFSSCSEVTTAMSSAENRARWGAMSGRYLTDVNLTLSGTIRDRSRHFLNI